MRIYFLSYLPAALKLNGLYAGTINGFEKHVELNPEDSVLAEIIPNDNLQPINFFIDEKFLKRPPSCADVYLMDGDALIYIREYAVKEINLDVIFQTRFCGCLITIFSQGGVYLSSEGADYTLKPLSPAFKNLHAEEKIIAGRNVLAIFGDGMLLLLSENGKIIYLNRAENAEFSDTLKVTVPFETCTTAKALCEFSYDGEQLTLVSSRTEETRQPEENVLHFAFFESVLTCGDFSKYLDEELRQKAGDLKSYLGDFVSVTVPTEKFYMTHENTTAAGLVYPKDKNLYEVKYFAVETQKGKISNIYPVE